MRQQFVFTLTGTDRVGLVEHVTETILKFHGNVESSKMAHLGGEFAILMLISVPDDSTESLCSHLTDLEKEGFQVSLQQTGPDKDKRFDGWLPFKVTVEGADHEGIVYHVTHQFTEFGINIETMDTRIVMAPMSGTPLFSMEAVVVSPPEASINTWKERLMQIGAEHNINIDVTPFKG